MANEPTEEKINREVIYVYEPITSFEEKAEKFEIKSACEYMIMSEYNYWLNQELDTAKGFFTKMLFSNTSSCKKVLDYDAQELRRKNAEFKKSLCGWMPEVGKSCFSFFKNEKERNFMQVHEGKEVKYDEAKATIEKLYQEYLESLPPLFEEGVQKVKEKTPNAHVLTVDEVQKLCDSGD